MTIDRRKLLAGAAGAAAFSTLPVAALGNQPGLGALMRQRAETFLSSLDEGQRSETIFEFGSRRRSAWNFMLGSRPAPGLALEEMTAMQKDLALDLLDTGCSTLGLEKAQNIMLQQDILRDEWGKGSPDRNRERFSLQLYGEPKADGAWSWRWEGHHLSLTFTLLNDEVIATTPSSYSSEPNTVPSGPHKGLVVLKEEEELGRALFTDLSAATRKNALVWARSPGNIRSNRGAEIRVAAEMAGVALGDLAQSQADMANRLIEVYTTEVLPPALATQQASRLAEEDRNAIRFAWGGADLDGSIYYRLTGKNLLIEFATLRNQPQHLHAVYHDIGQNFGRHLI